ncbi:hypothetical protein [Pseudonocardia phyllosphaerae]|uniref:hypothetical protein n=1 Tax=Pseudonocardia phyllosphaerae TaxID=3390502 RepID=UPI003979CA8F
MSIGRYVLTGVVTATFAAGACVATTGAAVSGPARTPLVPAATTTVPAAPAAGLLVGIDAAAAGPAGAAGQAIEAAAQEQDRVAAAAREETARQKETDEKEPDEKAAEQEADDQATAPEPAASDPAGSVSTGQAESSGAQESDTGCARRAMAAGKFDPSCAAYQGYLDPGTSAGRAPTSGEIQTQWACEKGLIPKNEC